MDTNTFFLIIVVGIFALLSIGTLQDYLREKRENTEWETRRREAEERRAREGIYELLSVEYIQTQKYKLTYYNATTKKERVYIGEPHSVWYDVEDNLLIHPGTHQFSVINQDYVKNEFKKLLKKSETDK